MDDDALGRFESDLRGALVRDREHQFAFDGKLKFYSSRYQCTLEAVSVFLDPVKQDIVLVGAFISGTPQFDYSKGFPVIQHELSLPFRECFRDMQNAERGFNETYLVSKTRKAVLDKCVLYPLNALRQCNADRDGTVLLSDFGPKDFKVSDSRVTIGCVGAEGRNVVLEDKDGRPVNIASVSLSDLSRLGERMDVIRALIQEARNSFLGERGKLVQENGTVTDWDLRKGAEKGLGSLHEKGYPLRVCYAVARTFSPDLADFFDDSKVSAKEVDGMMRRFRESGRLVEVRRGAKGTTFKF